MRVDESWAIMFLACWLEYHSDIPAARAYVAQIIAEQAQRAREFGIKWRKRWYSGNDRLHEISMRASPLLARMKAEREWMRDAMANTFTYLELPWPTT